MTDTIPDYRRVKIPDGKPPEEYETDERRADILRFVNRAGDPGAIKQTDLADRYDVHDSTISRDMDALRDSVDEHLGGEMLLQTQAEAKYTIRQLRDQGRYYKAWKVRKEYNELLFDSGQVEREPDRAEIDVRRGEVSYHVVREGEDEDLPTTEDGDAVDYEALGFTNAPAPVDVEPIDEVDE